MMNLIRTMGLVVLLALAARGDDWPHAGLDAGRTRVSPETIVSPSALDAGISTGSATVASPVAADGYIITAGLDGWIRAYRDSDRLLMWSTSTGSPVIGTPLIDQGRVYVPSSDGNLRILRLETGGSLGVVETGGADRSSPIRLGNRIYLGSGFPNTSLLAIDPVAQSVDWSGTLDQVTASSPAFGGGKVLIASNSGSLTAFDPVTKQSVWQTTVAGPPGTASPLIAQNLLISGNILPKDFAFLLAGAILTRVSLDPNDWDLNGSNGSLTLVDPVAAPATATDQVAAGSSLTLAGGLLFGTVRFAYPRDDYPPGGDGLVDQWTLREYAFGVDPATLAVVWQVPLVTSEVTLFDQNSVPPYGIVSSPVSLGPTVAFASSLVPTLQLLDPANGSDAGSFTLDAPCQASPIVANARLVAISTAGTLYAFEGASHSPPAMATGLSPANAEVQSTPADLTWNAVPGATSYLVRISSDGEILMTFEHELPATGASLPCPPLADGAFYTWGVRARDAQGAYSPWSQATFAQNLPSPPSGLTATPKHRKVLLSWTASPSASVTGYRLLYGPTGGGFGAPVDLGLVTSTTVADLAAGTSYTFQIQATNGTGGISSPVSVVATPLSLITLGGTGYDTIASAIAGALPGQVILLGADTFPIDSTLVLPPGVELRGVNALVTRIEASGPIIMIEATDGNSVRLLSLVQGLVGVLASGDGITITNCVIRDMSDAGIVVTQTASIVNNTIVRNTSAGIRSVGSADTRNNIIQENAVGLTGLLTSRYNDVSDGYALCVPGPGDRSAPVSFLDASSGDYREQPNQPSLDAGDPVDDFSLEPSLNGGRINMGAFGNTALAATSLTAGPPPASGHSSHGCGLTGLEVVLLLALLRRRR